MLKEIFGFQDFLKEIIFKFEEIFEVIILSVNI